MYTFTHAVAMHFAASLIPKPSLLTQSWSILSHQCLPGSMGVVVRRRRWGGGGSNWRNMFCACILRPEQWVTSFPLRKRLELGWKLQEKGCNLVLLVRDPLPSVYLGRRWCHSHDKMDQASFPSVFAYTASDQRWWEWQLCMYCIYMYMYI